MPKDDNIKSRY